MYRTSIVSSAFMIVFSIVLLAWIIPTQTPEYPGYGMPSSLMPNILAVIILLCAGGNLVKVLLSGTGKGQISPINLTSLGHCLAFIAVLAAAMPIMERVGYFIGGAVVMVACSLLCGERRFLRLAVVGAVTVALVYLALWKGLHVMLP